MKRVVFLVLLSLLAGCQSINSFISDQVVLSKDISFSLLTIKESGMDEQLVHKVKYIGLDGNNVDYLVQVSIDQQEDSLSLVATNLLGIPLFSFEVVGNEIINVNRVTEMLPEAERIMVDLQFMYWPTKSFHSSIDFHVSEECANSCKRQVFYRKMLIVELQYKQNKLLDVINFKNLLHGYKMQVTNL